MSWPSSIPAFGQRFLLKHPVAPLVSVLVVAAVIMALADMASPVLGPLIELAIDVAVFAALIPLIVRYNVTQALKAKRESEAAQAAALAEDHRVLARDLHDSIAQHLCYLHMRLDELTQGGSNLTSPALRGELERMRDVANEAYEDIYCLMSSLRSRPTGDLTNTLRARAALARQRAGFDTQVVEVGEPRKLQSFYEQEITLVVREALANAEKHAHARHVDIAINWTPATLGITVRDDGEGFEAGGNGGPGHFGLNIMKERAAEMGGQLRVYSQPGQGTVVELLAPLENLVDATAEPCA